MRTDLPQGSTQWLKIGRISGVHGVRGWVKVFSYTNPPEQIVSYRPWRIEVGGTSKNLEPVEAKFSGKALIVAIEGIDDRDQALGLRQADISVAADTLPNLSAGDYYWYQLEGLRVVSQFEEQTSDLGKVDHLIETGANDVLVVQGDQDSIDYKERLIPYIVGQTIVNIDLDSGEIQVEWDPEF